MLNYLKPLRNNLHCFSITSDNKKNSIYTQLVFGLITIIYYRTQRMCFWLGNSCLSSGMELILCFEIAIFSPIGQTFFGKLLSWFVVKIDFSVINHDIDGVFLFVYQELWIFLKIYFFYHMGEFINIICMYRTETVRVSFHKWL